MASRQNALDDQFDLLTGSGRVGTHRSMDFTPDMVTSTPQRDVEDLGNLAPPRRPPQLLIDETQRQPSIQPVDAMVSLAQSLNGLFQQFTQQASQMNTRKEKPTRTFAGQIYENPASFVQYMNEFFANNRINEDHIKIDIFRNQLRDAAKNWSKSFEGVPLTYRAFEGSFLRQYNSEAEKINAIALLYGDKQKINENVEVFLTKKRSLFSRVNPQLDEASMAEVLKEQLLPPIKSKLRNIVFVDILDLIHQAVKAESDVQEEAAYWAKVNNIARRNQGAPPQPQQTVRPIQSDHQSRVQAHPPSRPQGQQFPARPTQQPRLTTALRSRATSSSQSRPTPTTNDPTRPPTPCRYCQQWHYHRDCPMNPYHLNSRRVPEQRGSEQPQPSSAARSSSLPQQSPIQRQERPAPRPTRPQQNQVTVVAQVHREAETETEPTS